MTELLTAKEMQDLLQVDRSTIYRMAEDGRLPAVKVGKQWRFPAEAVENRFHVQVTEPEVTGAAREIENKAELAQLLPIDCVQQIQETFADLLGVMLVITDMEGNPVTEPSHTCGLFDVVSREPHALRKCVESWQSLAAAIEMEPRFSQSHLGLMCGRAFIRDGLSLRGMVVAGCVAPEQWPPSQVEVQKMAEVFDVSAAVLTDRIHDVHHLSKEERARVLATLQRIANIVAHILNERKQLVGRLQAIADLTKLGNGD